MAGVPFFAALLIAVGANAPKGWPPIAPGMTAYQKAMLDSIFDPAVAASKAAEVEMMQVFGSDAHRSELRRLGDTRLAELAPEEALAEFKRALDVSEYFANIGQYPFPNTSTIDYWGFYPNRWQRRIMNDSAMQVYTEKEFNMWSTGETTLYREKPFAKHLQPTWEEAAERTASYLSVNHRRLGAGVEQFGPFAMAYRESVKRERMLLIPGDSGGWECVCNKSIGLPAPWYMEIGLKLFFDCSGYGEDYMQPGWHPAPARPGHDLHLILHNMKAFRKLNIGLTRFMWQVLSPGAEVNMLESHTYLEASVLGAVTMRDLKMMVGSFYSLFGTKEGDDLIDFCRRHALPLVWGMTFGLNQDEKKPWNWLPPPMGRPTVVAGAARILDPRTVTATNASESSPADLTRFMELEKEVRQARSSDSGLRHSQFVDWWDAVLAVQRGGVLPLRGGECHNPDLCFGTDASSGHCLCRNDPDMSSTMVV